MKRGAAYAVGIDLGTTHSALAYLPLGEERAAPRVLGIPQLVHPGEVADRPLLPSYLYLPHAAELADEALRLPWTPPGPAPREVVGELARAQGALTPIRLVSSAKSWLCHPTLDRRAASLPVGSPEEVPRISPLDASARYLAHLRAAWDAEVAKGDPALALDRQAVTLTVPASFDAVARELTVEAARQAGLSEPVLLEEPQAALYAWVEAMGDGWRKLVQVGDLILVVDVGGGTTDFSLIAVVDRDGELGLERVAVGDHLLLGGDNMDLALAHRLQQKLADAGKTIDRWQLLALTHGARQAKELLFADRARMSVPVTIPGRGSSLMGGALRVELTRGELNSTLVDGFLPRVDVTARPAAQRRAALTTLGLPYASDPAITRQLAAFLSRQREALDASSAPVPRLSGKAFLHPTALLFNGGVMKAAELEERVREVVAGWVAAEGGAAPRALPGVDLDLAVAKGAASYGRVRGGRGIRIRGGTARAYYVGVETAAPAVPGLPPPVEALCVAPMGMEEGTAAELPRRELGLVVGEPARFRFFASSLRRDDRVGAVVEREAELEELPPIETTLPAASGEAGQVVPVALRAHVTELGTLELEAADAQGRAWRVEFNLRAAEQPQA
ncbi:Hsp70 family protein [Anaeromyxobacter diazotrophicus]|uniref:Heat-shock protein n=1 Tax=Anaeromyxobacter diazotrophicus TaxID=2590199 RepID=A0A7I9VP59_9BACT|nr:Hsp70 family protein [Anaeromyxobacter diazotrophicus]GEJ58192.1 heat-shock protein [Anaeromyxobacter diazotrophicus]